MDNGLVLRALQRVRDTRGVTALVSRPLIVDTSNHTNHRNMK